MMGMEAGLREGLTKKEDGIPVLDAMAKEPLLAQSVMEVDKKPRRSLVRALQVLKLSTELIMQTTSPNDPSQT